MYQEAHVTQFTTNWFKLKKEEFEKLLIHLQKLCIDAHGQDTWFN